MRELPFPFGFVGFSTTSSSLTVSLSLRHRGCFTELEAWRFMQNDWGHIPGHGLKEEANSGQPSRMSVEHCARNG